MAAPSDTQPDDPRLLLDMARDEVKSIERRTRGLKQLIARAADAVEADTRIDSPGGHTNDRKADDT